MCMNTGSKQTKFKIYFFTFRASFSCSSSVRPFQLESDQQAQLCLRFNSCVWLQGLPAARFFVFQITASKFLHPIPKITRSLYVEPQLFYCQPILVEQESLPLIFYVDGFLTSSALVFPAVIQPNELFLVLRCVSFLILPKPSVASIYPFHVLLLFPTHFLFLSHA